MKEGEKNNSRHRVDGYGLVNAKSRNWTDEEVSFAVDYLKREIPEEWAEVERLELTTGDLNGSDANDTVFGKLFALHPNCEFNEVSQLESKVRRVRRLALGLDS